LANRTRRPKLKTLEVEILDSGRREKRTGPDLNDVLRGVVIDLKNAWGLSTRAMAQRLGVRQQTFAAFIDDGMDQGTRVETLARMCIALDMGPGELFEMHPDYGESRSADRTWQILRNSLPADSMATLLETVMIGNQLNVLPGFIKNMNEMVHNLAAAQGLDSSKVSKEARQISRGR